MGIFVFYLNFGGSGVERLMINAKRNLRDLPEDQRRQILVVARSTHVYRLHYCVRDPTSQARSVTRHMINMSTKVDAFISKYCQSYQEE